MDESENLGSKIISNCGLSTRTSGRVLHTVHRDALGFLEDRALKREEIVAKQIATGVAASLKAVIVVSRVEGKQQDPPSFRWRCIFLRHERPKEARWVRGFSKMNSRRSKHLALG